MRPLLAALCLAAAPLAAQDIEWSFPAQTFTSDPAHTSVLFSVNHIGFSQYTAGFDDVAATLWLDPDAPESSKLSATIRVDSLDLPTPPEGFREMLLGPDWLDATAYPEMTYVADRIIRTGEKTATVEGTLTLRGVSAPVTLEVTYNGGWGKQPFEPAARAGFSARGELKRSVFGMGFGVPPEGSDFGVSDMVKIVIETEWTGEPFR